MRKRSGGLHSDSSEEFMLLAQFAQDKTGYYYDELLHAEVGKKMRKKIKRTPNSNEPNTLNTFQGFDFATQDQEMIEENQELWAHSHTIQINLVLICQHPHTVRGKLQEIWPQEGNAGGEGEARALDLVVHRLRHSPQHEHCFKFWILDAKQADNMIYSSYLSRAKKIFRFGEGGPEWLSESEVKGVVFETVFALAD